MKEFGKCVESGHPDHRTNKGFRLPFMAVKVIVFFSLLRLSTLFCVRNVPVCQD